MKGFGERWGAFPNLYPVMFAQTVGEVHRLPQSQAGLRRRVMRDVAGHRAADLADLLRSINLFAPLAAADVSRLAGQTPAPLTPSIF